MKQPYILVVDDEADNFMVIEALLSKQDYELHYAAGGEEAIAALHACLPDLILLDVMMPRINGIELCQHIKSKPKWQAIPIIMVTALNSKADLARCLAAGADDFISKPVNSIELRARVQSMLRIKHQYDDLQTLLKLREDMVNMVVHDLRNPLSSILFGLDVLRTAGYPPEKQQAKLSQIHGSAQALQGLIDDLLKIALLESGKICLNCTEVDMVALVQSAVSNFEAIAAQKKQSLVSHLPNVPQQTVYADPAIMHRALDNLISNAIKFSPRQGEIMVKVDYPSSGHCQIQVIDAGPGVPEGLQQKIFEKYEVGTLMPDVSQIGLGLAFCKMVVEAHGGKISVRNNEPKGAIFEITLAALAA
ncbi:MULTISPECIES: hybrid sensor histidine kinase/response regulator [unclassified Leptolyngbya]|uniref:hybrid sensor histidine kinase/response regulator n=1 Tax=unclassified Leptolyngbya TaxID=2650499 RepID=UPI001688271C|nr:MULTISPECIES: hybrid sensor histidine kinase/response regulator [unclassified Leptolyngbya]MBD1911619.1 hybrid sensor histidine kinase/response regulator [Leptolyngbya sp. FACHB-8]MBD2153184.1 hybrid sensor histidine kinase/response regulator [Leptolyngbya sp. FACHB-16]